MTDTNSRSRGGFDAIVLHPDDDVATALRPLSAGTVVEVHLDDKTSSVQVTEPIPRCHKLALRFLAIGASVRKYGDVIGVTTRCVDAGAHVHIHNLTSRRARVG